MQNPKEPVPAKGVPSQEPAAQEPTTQELANCNCLAVRQAARRVSQFYESRLAPLGLKASQYSILAKLSRLGPMSINEIAEAMVMDRTTTGRAVRPLEREGLVRIGAAEDGRKRVVALTPAGKKRTAAALEAWRKAQGEFERAFGAEASKNLRAMMKDVVQAVPETGAA
jgi:DNA-binding MarR family transcriptional regulator